MLKIACIGILVADIIANTIEKMPEKGKLELADNISLYTGGCATNTSIALSKLGYDPYVIGKVGNDYLGDFVLKNLKENGIISTGIKRESHTSATMVFVDKSGERSFIHSTGANSTIRNSEIDWEQLAKYDIVHIAGTFLMPGFDGLETARFLKKAKSLGLITTLDTAWDSKGRWLKILEESLPYIDYFLPSYEEAVELSNLTKEEEIADFFLNKGVKNVGIKLGDRGCYLANKDKRIREYSISVDVRDTTGAGDAWAAGFLAGLAEKWSLEETCRFANAVGASAVQEIGASTGIKSKKETLELIKEA